MALGSVLFLNPWMLLAIMALPLLWWVLRVMPPAPVRLYFPAIGLLMGLNDRQQTATSAPWWVILLRLAMMGLLILALSKPVLKPDAALSGEGTIIILVDDGWQAAAGWREKITSIGAILESAGRAERNIILQTTAPDYDASPPFSSGVMTASSAKIFLERLTPKPWDGDYAQVLKALSDKALFDTAVSAQTTVIWASDGVENAGSLELAARLSKLGTLTIYRPQPHALPMLVTSSHKRGDKLIINITRVGNFDELSIGLIAQDDAGHILARSDAQFKGGKSQTSAEFNLPAKLRNQISRISLEDRPGIGGVILLDEGWQRKSVGIVRENVAGQGLMLLSENYYLERALKPLGSLSQASVTMLLKAGQSVILLPDSASITQDDRQSLKAWVEDGGLLVRFAGDNLANRLNDDLLPVPLRQGGRSLGGAMLWAKPQSLSEFGENSPFSGLDVPEDAYVLRQLLAEPSPKLQDKTWARLMDDTPLVTADKRGKGWLVLFHSTANAEWSNIALSGLFVNMLERLIGLSQASKSDEFAHEPLPPLQLYDGLGAAMAPGAAAISITRPVDDSFKIGPAHPPGFYGNKIFKHAVNLSKFVTMPAAISDSLVDAPLKFYEDRKSLDFSGWLLAMALALLSLDCFVTLNLRGQLLGAMPNVMRAIFMLLAAGGLFTPYSSQAQNSANDDFALQASMGTVLAYVKTGDNYVDQLSFAGLAGLSSILNQRTAVEVAQPMAVDLASDELAFFPLIYWPISQSQPPLSRFAVERLNDYLANGGTLLIDTRDRQDGSLGNHGAQHLRRLAAGLSIPALERLPPGHVLSKSFYLLKEFPGRWRGHTLWVEPPSDKANDGVSNLVVGGNDWAGAWAVDAAGRPLYPIVPGGDEQREMAYRFGVNLVIYTLTGNYKADQVHVPAILERLGQ